MESPALNQPLSGMPTERPFLDPTEDLSPIHQAMVDQIAKAKGGKATKNRLLEEYVSKAENGQDTSSILKESFDGQMAQATAAAEALANPAGEFDHVGGVPQTHINPVGYPFGEQPGAAEAMAQGQNPMSTPISGQSQNALGKTPGQGGPAKLDVPQVDREAYTKASQNFYRLMEARPTMEGFPELEKPGMKELGLALLFAAVDQKHAGDILSAPFVFQQQKRAQAVQNIVQKYQLNEQDWKVAANLAKDTMDHTFTDLQNQRKEAGDAEQFNAGEQNKYDNLHFTQEQLTQRNTDKINDSKDRLAKILAQKDDAEGKKVLSRRAALLQIYPEAQYPGKADELTVAEFEGKLASAKLAEKRTWQIGELTPIIKQEKQAGIDYKKALTEYLPDRIALSAAALFQSQERFDFEVQRFYDQQDQREYDLKVKGAESARNDAKKDLDKLNASVEKAKSDYMELKNHVEAYKPLVQGIDPKTEDLAEMKTLAEYAEAVSKSNQAYTDWQNADKAAEEMSRNFTEADAKYQEAAKTLRARNRYTPPAKGKIIDRAKAFVRGKRPAPIPGEVPVDPTGPGYERIKTDADFFLNA